MKTKMEENIHHLKERFSKEPYEIAEEEIAIKQLVQKFSYALAQQRDSSLKDVPTKEIMNLIRKGHLTLIAQALDDTFLKHVEQIIKNSETVFGVGQSGSGSSVSNLYKRSASFLRGAPFHDVLLRMYTDGGDQGGFYKKINAIGGGYEDEVGKTTDDERQLALILQIAIHRAGLDKKNSDMQSTPKKLYRGQSHGFEEIEKKYILLQELNESGKLASLSSNELASINIADVAGKKIQSSSSKIKSTEYFQNNGFVLHIDNPEELGDYYSLENISAHRGEFEFATRIPDDIVMIPVEIEIINAVKHVHVICMRSKDLTVDKSSQYQAQIDSLKESIQNAEKQIIHLALVDRDQAPLLNKQLVFMDDLKSMIQTIENLQSDDKIDKQKIFTENCDAILIKLYNMSPKEPLKTQFDIIKESIMSIKSIFLKVNVLHEPHDINTEISIEQSKLHKLIVGLTNWSKSHKNVINMSDKLQTSTRTPEETKIVANDILTELKDKPELEKIYPELKERVSEIEKSLETIATLENSKPLTRRSDAPAEEKKGLDGVFKDFKQKFMLLINEAAPELENIPPSPGNAPKK